MRKGYNYIYIIIIYNIDNVQSMLSSKDMDRTDVVTEISLSYLDYHGKK